MNNPSALIYDCEIEKCIPERNAPNDPSLAYCRGWDDHANMGIAVIGVWDYQTQSPRVFLRDNFAEFAALVKQRETIIGFNSHFFDDLLCAANGIEVTTTYDLLVEVRRALGQPDGYVRGVTRSGYRLEDLARANLGEGKSGDGAQAPILWQRGQQGAVIDYCLRDVMLTKRLLESYDELKDPNDGNTFSLAYPPMWAPVFTLGQRVRVIHDHDNFQGKTGKVSEIRDNMFDDAWTYLVEIDGDYDAQRWPLQKRACELEAL